MAPTAKTGPRRYYPLLFRKKSLAASLDVSQGTIDNWIVKKWLPKPMKLGSVVCWRLDSVEQALEQLEEQFSSQEIESDADGENPFDDITA